MATQAINNGMSLEAIAALLGHASMSMTMTYARISDRTVATEYFAVTEQVEALYTQPETDPADTVEGPNMRRLRAETTRLLGKRALHPARRPGLPIRNDLRILHPLRHQRRPPRNADQPAQQRHRTRRTPPSKGSTWSSSPDSGTLPLDNYHPHKPPIFPGTRSPI
jgi:hypothetical protein